MTTKTLQRLETLCRAGGMSDIQLGAALGVSTSTVRYWRIKLRLPPGGLAQRGRRGPRPGWYYRVYDRKTGVLIVTGNSRDCADALFISLKSFYSMVWKSKNIPGYRYQITKTEDEEGAAQ